MLELYNSGSYNPVTLLPVGNYAAISVCENSKNILNAIEGSIYKALQEL
jgi:hypothetical protein